MSAHSSSAALAALGDWRWPSPECRSRLIDAPETIYFVQAEDGGPIKIGLAACVWCRLSSLQTGNPARLLLLATTVGDCVDEAELHSRFSRHRLRGEWFRPNPELLALIEGLRAQSREKSA